MKTTPIPVKFDCQGHSCNFYGGLGPTYKRCYKVTPDFLLPSSQHALSLAVGTFITCTSSSQRGRLSTLLAQDHFFSDSSSLHLTIKIHKVTMRMSMGAGSWITCSAYVAAVLMLCEGLPLSEWSSLGTKLETIGSTSILRGVAHGRCSLDINTTRWPHWHWQSGLRGNLR